MRVVPTLPQRDKPHNIVAFNSYPIYAYELAKFHLPPPPSLSSLSSGQPAGGVCSYEWPSHHLVLLWAYRLRRLSHGTRQVRSSQPRPPGASHTHLELATPTWGLPHPPGACHTHLGLATLHVRVVTTIQWTGHARKVANPPPLMKGGS